MNRFRSAMIASGRTTSENNHSVRSMRGGVRRGGYASSSGFVVRSDWFVFCRSRDCGPLLPVALIGHALPSRCAPRFAHSVRFGARPPERRRRSALPFVVRDAGGVSSLREIEDFRRHLGAASLLRRARKNEATLRSRKTSGLSNDFARGNLAQRGRARVAPRRRQRHVLRLRQLHLLSVGVHRRLSDDAVEVERGVRVAADAGVVADGDVDGAGGLLV